MALMRPFRVYQKVFMDQNDSSKCLHKNTTRWNKVIGVEEED